MNGPHRDFLAAGGLGLLIGDGALNYREEKILETFYTYNVNKWTTQRLTISSSPTRLTKPIVDRYRSSPHACMPSFELGPLTLADREAGHGAFWRG